MFYGKLISTECLPKIGLLTFHLTVTIPKVCTTSKVVEPPADDIPTSTALRSSRSTRLRGSPLIRWLIRVRYLLRIPPSAATCLFCLDRSITNLTDIKPTTIRMSVHMAGVEGWCVGKQPNQAQTPKWRRSACSFSCMGECSMAPLRTSSSSRARRCMSSFCSALYRS